MKKIAVVGSLNMDYFAETDQFPAAGETVMGRDFFMSLGGKGANQAIAAARLGGRVSMFGSIGNDENSRLVREKMLSENVDITGLQQADIHTGVAFIEISHSDNRIIVIPGANQHTDIHYIERVADSLLGHDIIVFQLETPLSMLEHIVPRLHEKGKVIILNPAPAQKLSPELVGQLTYLTPNEHEYKMVLSTDETKEEALARYPEKLVITCGTEGVKFHDGQGIVHIPALKVKAEDTTGAGDTFCGAMAVGLSEGWALEESIRFGSAAAGLSVRKKGAQTGMPARAELDAYLKGGKPDGAGSF
ncbi:MULTISPECIES: ribokinase [Bacillus]|uniref:Ribokinase n=1 Tax=Bacillus infantis TaxID=324767 RepID=A0A5D4SK49_9BACI|nr:MULTISPECIES: ribokinase [Bacillus]PLR73631.1 ribokinase [Bacillus sp. UMB0728]TYS63845.1 ribokinase [Bacillus infantis]